MTMSLPFRFVMLYILGFVPTQGRDVSQLRRLKAPRETDCIIVVLGVM